MSYHGRYGNLSAKDAAVNGLQDLELNLTESQREGLKKGLWEPLPEGYELLRLHYQVIGYQRVILMNDGNLNFSTLPLLWKRPNEQC